MHNAAQSVIGWPVLAGTAEVPGNTLEAISALSEEVPFEVRVGAQLPLGLPVSSAPVQGHIPAVVQSVIDKFMAVFPAKIPACLPTSRTTDHRIDLVPDAIPPCHCVFRNCPEKEVELLKQLAEYFDHGWIEPAHSAFGAGVLFAKSMMAPSVYVYTIVD